MAKAAVAYELDSDLRDLFGLVEADFREPITQAFSARQTCNENHPAAFHGWTMYAELVRLLRERLAAKDEAWERETVGGVELVTNRALKKRIAVVQGDQQTGVPDATPRTKHPVGPNKLKVITENWSQHLLHGGSELITIKRRISDTDGVQTWVLLHARFPDVPSRGPQPSSSAETEEAPKVREVRFELSLPDEIDDDGIVLSWKRRQHFAPYVVGAQKAQPAAKQPDDVNVPVRRKDSKTG